MSEQVSSQPIPYLRIREREFLRTYSLASILIRESTAGTGTTLNAGALHCLRCHEPTIVIVVRWMSHRSYLESLYNMVMWYETLDSEDGHGKRRAEALLKRKNVAFTYEWLRFFEESVNAVLGMHMKQPWQFETPGTSGAHHSNVYEMYRRRTPTLAEEGVRAHLAAIVAGE
jgi:hypothetical protein